MEEAYLTFLLQTEAMDEDSPPARPPEAPAGDSGPGLSNEERPTHGGIAAAIALGGMWGLFCYAVLWQGVPFSADRPFVESFAGTLVLLPVRIVLGAIRWAELEAGHPFSPSESTSQWIAFAASVVGALLVLVAFVLVRGVVRAVSRHGAGS